ncbi:hypothetical protein K435DRAFT_89097 [Dendrothele bispora CBS 962.96]|uniref:Uncharacterized protein n=1 Tax=Dendrothele bispora (strain CBS 962.96) TaxID=1314807 RepID=A0A4S8KPD0_DENBC|nr:hypothetical protein K435DRAFT_89097 [Dendrothele bispora CBS 962.96]
MGTRRGPAYVTVVRIFPLLSAAVLTDPPIRYPTAADDSSGPGGVRRINGYRFCGAERRVLGLVLVSGRGLVVLAPVLCPQTLLLEGLAKMGEERVGKGGNSSQDEKIKITLPKYLPSYWFFVLDI